MNPPPDHWAELDRVAAAHDLGPRQDAWRQRLSMGRHALIWAPVCALIAPVAISLRPGPNDLGPANIALITLLGWVTVMAVVSVLQLRSLRRRHLRIAQYADGIVLADGGRVHLARWEELSMSHRSDPLDERVSLVFRRQHPEVVEFSTAEWAQTRQIAAELRQRITG